MFKLSELKYLKYLVDFKGLILVFLIVAGIYLSIKSPKIKTSMELELYKHDSLNQYKLTNDSLNNIELCQ